MINISDLMQVEHPGHLHYISSKNVEGSDLPLFLDYCVNVVSRFHHHSEKNFQIGLPNKECINVIVSLMKDLDKTDEYAEVHNIRRKLQIQLIEFEFMCESMAQCFVSPSFVKNFYENLSEKLNDEIISYAGVEV